MVAALAVAAISGPMRAAAANFGPGSISADLTTFSIPRPPGFRAFATFTGPLNERINTGTPLAGGGTWMAVRGNWLITANSARNACQSNEARLTVDTGRVDVDVTDVLTLNPEVAGKAAGVLVRGLPDGSALAVMYRDTGGGSLNLERLGVGGTMASIDSLGPIASATIRVIAAGDSIRVWLNGTEVISYTLSGADRTTFTSPSTTTVGLISDHDRSTRHDDFRVEAL